MKRNLRKYCTRQNNEMNYITIQTLFYYISKKNPFLDIVGSSYNIINIRNQ